MNAKLAWKTKHYCLNDSLEKFASWQKKKAPNSWESSVYYLQRWIFPFYSQEKNCVNFNDWHLFLESYWIDVGQVEG
jgi:hypothetical protein